MSSAQWPVMCSRSATLSVDDSPPHLHSGDVSTIAAPSPARGGAAARMVGAGYSERRMARTLQVFPSARLENATWRYFLDVTDRATRGTTHFEHVVAAAVTAERPLHLLKVVVDLVVADTDTDQDVDAALFEDDIRPGPQVETVWGNWQSLAESIIGALVGGYTERDFWNGWRPQDTSAMRQDARRALVTQRGWTVTAVHQHEGDLATVTEE